jgi:hypothetical protein
VHGGCHSGWLAARAAVQQGRGPAPVIDNGGQI